MLESRFSYLFGKYFNKTASPDERDELMNLFLQEKNEEKIKSLLEKIWQEFNSQSQIFNESKKEEMLAEILKMGRSYTDTPVIILHKRPFRWIRIAAASAILFTIAIIYFLVNTKPSKEFIAKAKTNSTIKSVIAPGGNKAVLTLSDGSSIILDSTNQGTLANQGSSKVIQVNTGTLAYRNNNENSQSVVYNTLTTPKGGQFQLILPDGTKVWLNASSSIHYPTVFKGKERDVTITGEAYFEVARNESMPFNVTVKDMKVQVLGTHFNIMAYDDEGTINTTLLEGSVKVTNGTVKKILLPGQQSRVNHTNNIKVVDAEVEEVIAWKNGWFQFNANDIQTVMRQIARWYNVEIVYEGKIPSGHFSGIISRSNDISQVLKIMEAAGVRFKIEERKIIVLP